MMDKKHIASRVATANEAGLIVLLYEGLLDQLNDMKKFVSESNEDFFEQKSDKARNILVELIATLKGDSDIANHLRSIYIFINKLIVEGRNKKEAKKFEEAIGILTPLQEAWKELEKQEFERLAKDNEKKVEIFSGITYGKSKLNDYIINDEDRWQKG